jgi:hypothetical protein
VSADAADGDGALGVGKAAQAPAEDPPTPAWVVAARADPAPVPSRARAAAAQANSHGAARRAGTPIVATIRPWMSCSQIGNSVAATVYAFPTSVKAVWRRSMTRVTNHLIREFRAA